MHVVTDFIIYTHVCNKNSLLFFESPVIHSVAPQNLHEPLFSYAPWSIAFSQKHLKTITPAKFGGQTECIMGDCKIVN